MQAERTRRELLSDIADRNIWLIPAHFRGMVGMRIQSSKDGYLPVADDVPGDWG